MGRWRVPLRASSAWSCLALGAALALALPALGAEATEPFTSYRLRWDVPESLGCGSPEAFEQTLQERLGRRAFTVDATHSLLVEVVKQDQRWSLVVRVLDPAGAVNSERNVSSSDVNCTGIIASAALAVELMLSGETPSEPQPVEAELTKNEDVEPPDATASTLEAKGASGPSLETLNAETRPAEPPREAPPAPRSDSTPPPPPPSAVTPSDLQRPGVPTAAFELAVTGAGYLWILPEPRLGVHASLGYRLSQRWNLVLGGGLSQDWSGSYSLGDYRVGLTLAFQHLDLGVRRTLYESARWRHDVGLLALAGLLTPTVDGATSLRQSPLLWAGLGAGARTRLELAWGLGLSAAGSLVIPVTRDRLTEAEGELLAQAPPVGGLVTTGISADW